MSAIRFEVKTSEVVEKRGTATRTGKPYLIREQVAYIDTGKAYPQEMKINLNDLAPLAPGVYELTKDCVYVQRFGELGIDATKAQRLVSAQARPAA